MKPRIITQLIALLCIGLLTGRSADAQLPSSKPIKAGYYRNGALKPEWQRVNIPLPSQAEAQRLPSVQPISPQTTMSKSKLQPPRSANTSTLSEPQQKAKLPSNSDMSNKRNLKRPQRQIPLPPVSL